MQKDESSDLIRNILYQVTDLQGTQAWEQAHREIQGLREHNDKQVVVVKSCEFGGTLTAIKAQTIPSRVLVSKEIGQV